MVISINFLQASLALPISNVKLCHHLGQTLFIPLKSLGSVRLYCMFLSLVCTLFLVKYHLGWLSVVLKTFLERMQQLKKTTVLDSVVSDSVGMSEKSRNSY